MIIIIIIQLTSLQVLQLHGSHDITTLPMKGIMSEKKTHEVETMSRVVSRLAKGKFIYVIFPFLFFLLSCLLAAQLP